MRKRFNLRQAAEVNESEMLDYSNKQFALAHPLQRDIYHLFTIDRIACLNEAAGSACGSLAAGKASLVGNLAREGATQKVSTAGLQKAMFLSHHCTHW